MKTTSHSRLLGNVRMYIYNECIMRFRFNSETKYHYHGCDVMSGCIDKSRTRILDLEEQVDYVYHLCCQNDSSVSEYIELKNFVGGKVKGGWWPFSKKITDTEKYIKDKIRAWLIQLPAKEVRGEERGACAPNPHK